VEVLRTLSGTAPTWEYWLSSFQVSSLPVSNLRELSQPHMPPIPESLESVAMPYPRPHYVLRESQLTSREPKLNTLTAIAYDVREHVTGAKRTRILNLSRFCAHARVRYPVARARLHSCLIPPRTRFRLSLSQAASGKWNDCQYGAPGQLLN
jgi:hypothetical protein